MGKTKLRPLENKACELYDAQESFDVEPLQSLNKKNKEKAFKAKRNAYLQEFKTLHPLIKSCDVVAISIYQSARIEYKKSDVSQEPQPFSILFTRAHDATFKAVSSQKPLSFTLLKSAGLFAISITGLVVGLVSLAGFFPIASVLFLHLLVATCLLACGAFFVAGAMVLGQRLCSSSEPEYEYVEPATPTIETVSPNAR